MNLSQKEKDIIKYLHEITQIEYKTIETVFRGLHLYTVLNQYAKKKENATIDSALKTLPVIVPYLVSFEAEANMKSVYNKNLNVADLHNINFSQDLRDALKNMMEGNHGVIREGLIKELGDEFRNILDLEVPSNKIGNG